MIICYPPIRCKDVEGDHVCTRICDEYDALTPWLGDDDSFEEAIKFEVVYKEPGERDKKTWLTVRDVKDAKSNGESVSAPFVARQPCLSGDSET